MASTSPSAPSRPRLGYWNTRAIGEPIRLLLAYADVDYEDVRYEVGPPPAYDKKSWSDEKFKLGLVAPNLPYWIEPKSGLRLTQSRAILFHIAGQHDLAGATAHERALCQMAVDCAFDLFSDLFGVTYCNFLTPSAFEPAVHRAGEDQCLPISPRFVRMRATFLSKTLPTHLAHFVRFLRASNTAWLVGTASPTCADIVAAEVLDQLLAFEPLCLDGADCAALRELHARVLALPKVCSYRQSSFKAEPLHNRYSHFHKGWVGPNAFAARMLQENTSSAASADKSIDVPEYPGANVTPWRDVLIFAAICAVFVLLLFGSRATIHFSQGHDAETSFAMHAGQVQETAATIASGIPPNCSDVNSTVVVPCGNCCCGVAVGE